MKDYEYQQKRLKGYVLPVAVQRQAVWAVKDLERLVEQLDYYKAKFYSISGRDFSVEYDAGACVKDATAERAALLCNLTARIGAIEDALKIIPIIYRMGIRDHLVKDLPYSDEYHINTWRKWQQIFIYNVAVNLNIL